jgi:nucleoside-diphosphate-sugar epimerase
MAPHTVNRAPPPKNVTIALTGASGFLGAHIGEALLRRAGGFRAVVRNPDKLDARLRVHAEVAMAELGDEDAMTRAFSGAQIVVANAALGSHSGTLDDYVQINEVGVANTLRAAERAGVSRVVLISTVAVFRTRPFGAIGDDHPMRDESSAFDWSRFSTDPRYSLTKTRGERIARELAQAAGIELIVLRPGPVFGPGDTRFTARMLASLDRRVRFVPTVGVPLVYAGDVADTVALAALCHTLPDGPCNLAGEPTALSTFVRTLVDVADAGGVVVPVPVPLSVRFETTRAATQLGFTNRPLRDALALCVSERTRG